MRKSPTNRQPKPKQRLETSWWDCLIALSYCKTRKVCSTLVQFQASSLKRLELSLSFLFSIETRKAKKEKDRLQCNLFATQILSHLVASFTLCFSHLICVLRLNSNCNFNFKLSFNCNSFVKCKAAFFFFFFFFLKICSKNKLLRAN